jgi:hypothetical protein
MRIRYCLVVIIILCIFAGCSKRAAQTQNVALPPGVILPDWAPKNPSPEFIRAAKVLKPIPPEPGKNDPQTQALVAKVKLVTVPAWEFFGTLSDQDISSLQAGTDVSLRYDSMSDKQRNALNNWLEVWRQTMKDIPEGGGWKPDWLVVLYRYGAKEDLSNVLCTFKTKGNHIVQFWLQAIQSDGNLSTPVPCGLGYI